MRHLAALFLLLCSTCALAQTYDCYYGSAQQGGSVVTVNGIQSAQSVQQSFPSATVSVFDHGTTNLSTIYSSQTGTAQVNPFTASPKGVAFWCAGNGVYDVQYSGTGITTPFTVTSIHLCYNCKATAAGAAQGDIPAWDVASSTYLPSSVLASGAGLTADTIQVNTSLAVTGSSTITGPNTVTGTNTVNGANVVNGASTFTAAAVNVTEKVTGIIDSSAPSTHEFLASGSATPSTYVRLGGIFEDFSGGVKSRIGLFSDGVPFRILCNSVDCFDGDTSGNLTFPKSFASTETTAPSAATGSDICYGDSVAHTLKCSYNNGSFFTVPLIGIANTWTAANSFSQQVTSTLATGTAPFSIASTTPVANLTTVPATYNAAGTQQTGVHLVKDTCTLGTSCAITLAGSAVFTSGTSYDCWARDATTAANAVTVTRTSGTALAFTGTGTDVINYVCIGN